MYVLTFDLCSSCSSCQFTAWRCGFKTAPPPISCSSQLYKYRDNSMPLLNHFPTSENGVFSYAVLFQTLYLICRQLAVSLEVEKACTQFLLQTDRVCIYVYMYIFCKIEYLSLSLSHTQPCSTTVDGLYPLAEVTLSTKIYLFLKPLERREPLHFVQVNTVPLTISILHEGSCVKCQDSYA